MEASRAHAEPARLVRSLLCVVADESAVCRLCCAGAGAVSLHDEVSLQGSVVTLELREVLAAVAGSTIDKDALPATLCLACTDAAVSSYKFLQLCHSYSSTLTSLANLVQTSATEVSSELQRLDAQSLFLLLDDNEIIIDTSDKINDTKVAVRRLKCLFKKKRELNLQCNHCGKTFRKKEYLRKHIGQCKDIFDKNRLPYDFGCPYDGCSKTYHKRSILNMHIMRMHEVKKYPCIICKKKFGSLVLVEEHARHMHKYRECHICREGFIGGRALLAHKRSYHELTFDSKISRNITVEKALNGSERDDSMMEQKSFMCDKCYIVVSTKFSMVRHLRICSGKLDFKCPHEGCFKAYHKRSILNMHIMRMHQDKKHPCYVCDKKYGSPLLVKEHMRSNHAYKECSVCRKGFFGRENLRSHEKTHKELLVSIADKDSTLSRVLIGSERDGDMNRIKLQCDNCGKLFRRKSAFAEHVRVCSSLHREVFESSDGTFACSAPGCDEICQTRPKLHLHIARAHEDRKYPCSTCSKKFSTRAQLALHVSNIHEYKECPVCNTPCLGRKSLRVHEQTHRPFSTPADAKSVSDDGKYDFICDLCGQRLYTASQVRRHLVGKHRFPSPRAPKKGQVKKTFQCEICNIFCQGKHIMKSHIERVHLGKKGELPCLVCGKYFHRNNELKRHMITHTRERPELCTVCGRRFVNKAALLYHTRLHTGERPYPCALCGERFLSSSRRGNHMRVRHGTHPQCPVCHKSFTSTGSMKKHLRKFHSAEAPPGKVTPPKMQGKGQSRLKMK